MKNLILFVTAALISIPSLAQNSQPIRLSDPVQETEDHEVFGEKVDEWNEVISLETILNNVNEYDNKVVTVQTKASKVCQKKGCFFVAVAGDKTARITFKDYGFFIPTDSEGKEITLVGTFTVTELTEEMAKHYAEDVGDDAISIKGPQKEYSFVATSVKVPKS